MIVRHMLKPLGALLFLTFLVIGPALAEASPITDQFAAAPGSAQDPAPAPDHGPWDRLLEAYISQGPDGVARFDYGGVLPEDRAALEGYIAHLAAQRPTQLTRPQQLAYWINLYNALTVEVVLDHYPVQSIRRIKFGRLLALGPWGKDLIEVDGTPLSLDDIEHRILRPVFQDPRIHYGVNCASIGCPDLRAEAYRGEIIDDQLESAARTYINHTRGVEVRNGRLRVSSIYHWFSEDFGETDTAVIAHLRQYAEPDLAATLDEVDRIARHHYNWQLNDRAGE